MRNLEIYEGVEQNEECPCGSGEKFKGCCMNEYKMLKAEKKIKRLTQKEIERFVKFYKELILFSCQYENGLKKVNNEKIDIFTPQQIEYFYDNRDEIIESFRKSRKLSNELSKLLDGISRAVYGEFYLYSYTQTSALVYNKNFELFLVQSLRAPFPKLFQASSGEKIFVVITSMIPYKNSYIFDGYLKAKTLITTNWNRKILESAISDKEIKVRESSMVYIPFNINIALFCEKKNFEKIDRILLEELPENFTKGLLDFFDANFINKVSLISCFLRIEDLLYYLDDNEDEYLNIIDDVTTSHSKRFVAPYLSLKKQYKQTSLSQSVAKEELYDTLSEENGLLADAFYTLQGVISLESDRQDEFHKFLDKFDEKEVRSEFMEGFKNLFLEINDKEQSDAEVIFIDVTAYDFSNIIESLNKFVDFANILKSYDFSILQHYSIHKNRVMRPLVKDFFGNLVGKLKRKK